MSRKSIFGGYKAPGVAPEAPASQHQNQNVSAASPNSHVPNWILANSYYQQQPFQMCGTQQQYQPQLSDFPRQSSFGAMGGRQELLLQQPQQHPDPQFGLRGGYGIPIIKPNRKSSESAVSSGSGATSSKARSHMRSETVSKSSSIGNRQILPHSIPMQIPGGFDSPSGSDIFENGVTDGFPHGFDFVDVDGDQVSHDGFDSGLDLDEDRNVTDLTREDDEEADAEGSMPQSVSKDPTGSGMRMMMDYNPVMSMGGNRKVGMLNPPVGMGTNQVGMIAPGVVDANVVHQMMAQMQQMMTQMGHLVHGGQLPTLSAPNSHVVQPNVESIAKKGDSPPPTTVTKAAPVPSTTAKAAPKVHSNLGKLDLSSIRNRVSTAFAQNTIVPQLAGAHITQNRLRNQGCLTDQQVRNRLSGALKTTIGSVHIDSQLMESCISSMPAIYDLIQGGNNFMRWSKAAQDFNSRISRSDVYKKFVSLYKVKQSDLSSSVNVRSNLNGKTSAVIGHLQRGNIDAAQTEELMKLILHSMRGSAWAAVSASVNAFEKDDKLFHSRTFAACHCVSIWKKTQLPGCSTGQRFPQFCEYGVKHRSSSKFATTHGAVVQNMKDVDCMLRMANEIDFYAQLKSSEMDEEVNKDALERGMSVEVVRALQSDCYDYDYVLSQMLEHIVLPEVERRLTDGAIDHYVKNQQNHGKAKAGGELNAQKYEELGWAQIDETKKNELEKHKKFSALDRDSLASILEWQFSKQEAGIAILDAYIRGKTMKEFLASGEEVCKQLSQIADDLHKCFADDKKCGEGLRIAKDFEQAADIWKQAATFGLSCYYVYKVLDKGVGAFWMSGQEFQKIATTMNQEFEDDCMSGRKISEEDLTKLTIDAWGGKHQERLAQAAHITHACTTLAAAWDAKEAIKACIHNQTMEMQVEFEQAREEAVEQAIKADSAKEVALGDEQKFVVPAGEAFRNKYQQQCRNITQSLLKGTKPEGSDVELTDREWVEYMVLEAVYANALITEVGVLSNEPGIAIPLELIETATDLEQQLKNAASSVSVVEDPIKHVVSGSSKQSTKHDSERKLPEGEKPGKKGSDKKGNKKRGSETAEADGPKKKKKKIPGSGLMSRLKMNANDDDVGAEDSDDMGIDPEYAAEERDVFGDLMTTP